MTAEILWNSSMILRLNGRQGQGQGKRSLEARADAFSRLKSQFIDGLKFLVWFQFLFQFVFHKRTTRINLDERMLRVCTVKLRILICLV